jgi:hypothetical protein
MATRWRKPGVKTRPERISLSFKLLPETIEKIKDYCKRNDTFAYAPVEKWLELLFKIKK